MPRTSPAGDAAVQAEAPRRGRPRRGPDPERFQEIVDAAADIILEKGYVATSIQDIADAVGILKGSLYHYVKTKEDFLFAIIKRVYDAALDEIGPLAEIDADALVRLRSFVDSHVGFAARNLTGFSIQMREFRHLSSERQEEITAGGDAYVSILRRILRDGQSEGVVDKNLDVRLSSIVLVGQLNYMAQWYSPEGPASAETISQVFSSLILSSVASDSAVKAAGGVEKLRSGTLP